jgi:superfamily II DNA or RNA helicase
VENYLKICPSRLFINFAVDIRHAKMLADEFKRQGVNGHLITKDTPDHTRHKLFRELARGEIRGLISVGCLSVGFDVPNISCVILSRPTLSVSLFIQQVGRGMRLAPDKTECIVLDQSGNVKRFGSIESIEYPDLEDNDFQLQPPPTKECPECERILDMFAKVCPCGHVFESEGEGREKIKPVGEMEIIVAPQDTKAYEFYRKKLIEAYLGKKSPDWAVMQVKLRFQRYPKRLWARETITSMFLKLDETSTTIDTKKAYINYLHSIIKERQSGRKLSKEKKANYNDKWIQKHFHNEFGVAYEPPP